MRKSIHITVNGLVQGIGFRPFVYGLARKTHIVGQVQNDGQGVTILATGETTALQKFTDVLLQHPPPLAAITNCEVREVPLTEMPDFLIKPSTKGTQLNALLTPDFAICENCTSEIHDQNNRRFGYAFTTCVHCGPRWSITQQFPFDREHTTADDFSMCPSCRNEYEDPANRRFHSQTNSCPDCGISWQLFDNKGNTLPIAQKNMFTEIAKKLSAHYICAVKNNSGFLLCCRADDANTIAKLRTRKQRPEKPLAVLFKDMQALEQSFQLSTAERKILESPARPIVLLSSKNYNGNLPLHIIAPGLQQMGVMLPTTGILELLATAVDFPLIATSGNIHGSPILSQNQEAHSQLNGVADFFLCHNLKIIHPQDDSVVKFSKTSQKPILLRRARGYAPNYLKPIKSTTNKPMALGADLKNSIAFMPNTYAYVSAYLGNLENYEVYKRFSQTIDNYATVFNTKPTVLLTDKHPSYNCNRQAKTLAEQWRIPKVDIQHHQAHFAAVLGEHQLFDDRVLGVVFDGTGYGDDGQIWGGEFFSYQNQSIERIHHLEYFDWLAGDKMAKEPRLSLLSLSKDNVDCKTGSKFTPAEYNFYKSMKRPNNLKTSSVGRLFDAVAALLDLTDYNTYEGQAAMMLENLIVEANFENCVNYLNHAQDAFSGSYILQFACNELNRGVPKPQIAANFIFTLANYILDFAGASGYQKIAFSGGVFQNTILVDFLRTLAPNHVALFFHEAVPPNDENIALGQLMYHLHINRKL
ncbi:MAG: carbamoyltransferase HypF [Flavobacteriaceae bacterium]|nr:carbamoyltransferase HypF [Flavobacteriaceae bacterium]